MTIRPANSNDLPAIFDLLLSCRLPIDGLANHLPTTVVARDGDRIVACSGIEMYQEFALLRSVAVQELYRGQGLGKNVTQAALELAARNNVQTIYLLTENATRYFAKFGFRQISRSEVPEKVRRSDEFTTACPETASVMALSLSNER